MQQASDSLRVYYTHASVNWNKYKNMQMFVCVWCVNPSFNPCRNIFPLRLHWGVCVCMDPCLCVWQRWRQRNNDEKSNKNCNLWHPVTQANTFWQITWSHIYMVCNAFFFRFYFCMSIQIRFEGFEWLSNVRANTLRLNKLVST